MFLHILAWCGYATSCPVARTHNGACNIGLLEAGMCKEKRIVYICQELAFGGVIRSRPCPTR